AACAGSCRRVGLCYIRDDKTEEDVFGLAEGLAMGVRVVRNAESWALFYLKHQREVEEVLQFLVDRVDRTPETDFQERTGVTGNEVQT
ncbi:MAG: hypothetical protein Q8S75_03435, partial [Nitrospirota bacterium]|nr:hypothetical protein [Nitrospirota bacterium]